MTTLTLRERERNGAVALPAKPSFQYRQHADVIRATFGDKYPVMAVAAVQPLGVLAMRKAYHRLAGGIGQNDIEIKQIDLGARVQAAARRDHAGTHRRVPINEVAFLRCR